MTGIRRVTRRRFLRRATTGAAAAWAGPAIVPSSVLGLDGQVAPSNRVTVGMIGMGRQALAYNLSVVLRWPDSEVVALCDADRWRLGMVPDQAAKRFGADAPGVAALKNEKRDFIDCVKTRGRTMEDAEVGHRATSLCQIGYIAVQVGEKLQWDPGTERFVGNDDANRLLSRPPGRQPWRV